MKGLEIRNYAAFRHEEGKKPYEVVTDDAGNELGIRVTGYLTTWNEVNANGQSWTSTAYDKNVRSYFENNALNIPLDVMHVRDLNHLAGIVESCEKDGHGLLVSAFVTAGAACYSVVKSLIDCGALQGFSNYGYLTDYSYTDKGELLVKEFMLISASLVDVPADTGGKFIGNRTEFKGFGEDKRKENKVNNIYGLIF